MNEKQNYEINEQLVKEALVSVSQNRVLELTSQNLLYKQIIKFFWQNVRIFLKY